MEGKENLIQEYISHYSRILMIDRLFDYAAYKWIQYNIGIADETAPSGTQIGKAVVVHDVERINQRGYSWTFDNLRDPQKIVISYSIIKNEWGDVDDEKEVTLTFSEFAKYI